MVAEQAPDRDGMRALLDVSGDGLVLLDAAGRVRYLNDAAARLLGSDGAGLLGRPGPFPVPAGTGANPSTADGAVRWAPSRSRPRELEYRIAAGPQDGYAVWFRDVTDVGHQQARLTAIARAASSVTASGALAVTLEAVAQEIVRTPGINAVQILAVDDPAADLRVLGMAGFGAAPEFVDRLGACRRLGADVRFLDAFTAGVPVVVPSRKAAIMADAAWEPLHEIMDRPDWDGFVSMPMIVRAQVLGVVNAYYEPGADPGPASVAFLEAMADHAAIAVDTAALLTQTRARAESDERRRLARELHDSVVQQMFSMRMQATVLRSQLDNGAEPEGMRASAEELASLSSSALTDLRRLVFELRPLELAEQGLVDALRRHAAAVGARTGLRVDVHTDRARIEAGLDLQEDVYRIVSEAVHNVVKHAGASAVEVGIEVDGADLVVDVSDDGTAAPLPADEPVAGARLGLVSMRERTERWGGRFAAGPRPGGGWAVRLAVPLPGGGRTPR
ncbi:histidine kinase [Pseudonocardia sp. KRD291]|uniref:PAS domain-containing sensor histidine kinase n=1 Tax=Pseudonocardia sp. KRD291 TaxID=2792007 RepID=UPI001C4A16D2|nr:histidine kinase [Pseudonocardia sp. KRD291]MBW0106827.1 GAF domain-containing protein [Pseudonocardia sp. KRD291]